MRYARRMNGYSEVPHNGEINNYLRKDLDAKATAKNTACWNLLGKVRTKRTLCFSLYTALELCGVELPRHSTLPQKDFYVTVRSKGTRSSLDNVDYRIWNAKFNSIAFSNGVVVPERLRTLDHGRPWRDDQFAACRVSSSRDMSR